MRGDAGQRQVAFQIVHHVSDGVAQQMRVRRDRRTGKGQNLLVDDAHHAAQRLCFGKVVVAAGKLVGRDFPVVLRQQNRDFVQAL